MNSAIQSTTDSLWLATARPFRASVLRKPISVDVCIVGAGITGLSVAYHLAKDGLSVAVLDAGKIGCGETSVTSAHLVTALDRRYEELVAFHGERRAQLIADSHRAAIAAIHRIAREEKIDCEFDYCEGYLVGTGDRAQQIIDSEQQAAVQAGLDATVVSDHPFRSVGEPCLKFPRQAKFHPMKYLHGLAAFVKKHGGHVHHNTMVKDVVGGKDAHVETEAGVRVDARHVVVAANTPVNNRFTMHTRIAAYRSYVVGFDIGERAFPDLVWDTDEPFHYVRCHKGILLVGGEDHKTGQGDSVEVERFDHLETWTRERFPAARERRFAWSGQVMESLDGIAYIGRNPGDEDNVYIATGDCGNGLTHGTIAGIVLSTLIQGRENPWAEVYDPSRTRIRGAWKFVKENVNVAAQYAAWVTPGDVADVKEIARDSGAIVRRGASKVAVYRDGDGAVHEMSAVCPHLNCIVDWNSAEKSWDCPCHGSRFRSTGEVLNGPAISGLKPVEEAAEEKPAAATSE